MSNFYGLVLVENLLNNHHGANSQSPNS